jgi:hypothetical protein
VPPIGGHSRNVKRCVAASLAGPARRPSDQPHSAGNIRTSAAQDNKAANGGRWRRDGRAQWTLKL